MSLKKYLSPDDLVQCDYDCSASYLAEVMAENGVGSVVIVSEGGKPIGIVTDRDLVCRALALGAIGSNLKANEVMSSPIHFVYENDSISDVIVAVKQNEVRRILVCDESGSAVGLISSEEIMELLVAEMNQLSCITTTFKQKLSDQMAM